MIYLMDHKGGALASGFRAIAERWASISRRLISTPG